jgi:aquaporin Z
VPRPRDYVAEFAGTFLLLLNGLSAVAVFFAPGSPVPGWLPNDDVRRLLTGIWFAGGAAVIVVSPIGKTSGGHLNPAVTIGMWRMGKVTPAGALGYALSQVAGALTGAAAARIVWRPWIDGTPVGVTMPGDVSDWVAFVAEVICTLGLTSLIFAFVDRPRLMRFTPIAASALVATLVFLEAPISGTSLNPARSLGPALVAGATASLWIYLAAPPIGALAAAALRRATHHGVACGKLIHDPAYVCRFLDCSYTPPAERVHAGPLARAA